MTFVSGWREIVLVIDTTMAWCVLEGEIGTVTHTLFFKINIKAKLEENC